MVRRVILDVDTGIDDALGILLALNSPELEVMGVTTVSGNVDVEEVTRNTLQVLELADSEEIPVAMGVSIPMASDKKSEEIIWIEGKKVAGGEYFHGKDGLGNTGLPLPRASPVDKNAIDFLINQIESNPDEITLITTAPLTNIGMAIQKKPEIAELVSEHIMMGGAYKLTPYGYGNVTPVSEFNIWVDPMAADIVLSSKLPTIAVGLDITQSPSVKLRRRHLDYISRENKLQGFVRQLISFYIDRSLGAACPHDPIAVAAAIDERIFKMRELVVRVEKKGTIARGQTIVENRPHKFVEMRGEARNPNVKVCYDIAGERFMDMFLKRLSELG